MSNVQANSTYSLINAKGGTCLDLSGGDNTSVIGYGLHDSDNQKWTFESVGDGTFNVKTQGSGKYLAAAGDLGEGQKVIGGSSPFAWRVEDVQGVDNGVRLIPANNNNLCLDLSDHGNSTPGTPVALWGRWEGQNQVWKLKKQ